jgi:hypothetical protein
MKIDSNYKVGIVSSVIASCIFLIFLQPILHGVSGILFGVGSTVFRAYTDRLFAQSALLVPPDSSFDVLECIVVFMTAVVTGYTVARIAFWRTPIRSKAEDKPDTADRFPWKFLVLTAFIAFAAVAIIYGHLFQLRVITSFKQHMTAIAPYISDAQTKQLYSEWTQMRNKADYLRIYAKLEPIAQQNNIRLPENIVFSFKQL